jgi:hypothetical protein
MRWKFLLFSPTSNNTVHALYTMLYNLYIVVKVFSIFYKFNALINVSYLWSRKVLFIIGDYKIIHLEINKHEPRHIKGVANRRK